MFPTRHEYKHANDNIPQRIRDAVARYSQRRKDAKVRAYEAGVSKKTFFYWVKKIAGFRQGELF